MGRGIGRALSVCAFCLILAGCAAASMSEIGNAKPVTQPITRIAIAPGSGPLGDAIGVELFNLGYHIVDARQTKGIIGSSGLQQFEVYSADGYAALRRQGIEAVLTAKGVAVKGLPESASVRVTSTRNGDLLAGLTWQNGWGGMSGSIADRVMRNNLSDVSQSIARALDKRLRGSDR